MHVVFIGVSHWHTSFYLEPALALPGVRVVGVSDPDLARTHSAAAQAGCPAWADYREMCAATRPDFAFVLGRHCDMAAAARYLIASRIGFAIEKPAGIDTAELRDIAARAAEAGVFAAVPLVFRLSPMLDAITTIAAGEQVHYAGFRFIGGLTDRYREAGCDWMLRRALAGGGALINLGVHFLDLCRVLLPDGPPAVAGAIISNATAGLEIEDHAVVLLRSGQTTGVVETGYMFPAPHSVFDLHYSIRTERHYFVVRDAETLEVIDAQRQRQVRTLATINAPLYPAFVADTFRRLSRGDPPLADLTDMAEIMQLVEHAYRASPLRSAGQFGLSGAS